MPQSGEPIKETNDLLRMIDDGIAALQTDDEFSLTLNAISDVQSKVENKK